MSFGVILAPVLEEERRLEVRRAEDRFLPLRPRRLRPERFVMAISNIYGGK
jgi:hypothetical protein